VSKRYWGLCAYVNGLFNFKIDKSAKIHFFDNTFLVFGTEQNSFSGWAGRTSLYMGKTLN
jgi:hypothetical protein